MLGQHCYIIQQMSQQILVGREIDPRALQPIFQDLRGEFLNGDYQAPKKQLTEPVSDQEELAAIVPVSPLPPSLQKVEQVQEERDLIAAAQADIYYQGRSHHEKRAESHHGPPRFPLQIMIPCVVIGILLTVLVLLIWKYCLKKKSKNRSQTEAEKDHKNAMSAVVASPARKMTSPCEDYQQQPVSAHNRTYQITKNEQYFKVANRDIFSTSPNVFYVEDVILPRCSFNKLGGQQVAYPDIPV